MIKRLNQLVKESPLSVTEICNKAGVSRSSFYEYLNGEAEPRFDTLEAICTVLNVSVVYLLGYDVPRAYNTLNEAGKGKVDMYINDLHDRYKK